MNISGPVLSTVWVRMGPDWSGLIRMGPDWSGWVRIGPDEYHNQGWDTMGYWIEFHTSRHVRHTSRGHLISKFIPKIMSFIPKNVWFIPPNLCFIPRKNHGYLMILGTGYWVQVTGCCMLTGPLDITTSSDWLIECRMTTLITQCFDWMHSFNSVV